MTSAKALLNATLAGDASKASPPRAPVKAEGVETGDVGGSNGKLARLPSSLVPRFPLVLASPKILNGCRP